MIFSFSFPLSLSFSLSLSLFGGGGGEKLTYCHSVCVGEREITHEMDGRSMMRAFLSLLLNLMKPRLFY